MLLLAFRDCHTHHHTKFSNNKYSVSYCTPDAKSSSCDIRDAELNTNLVLELRRRLSSRPLHHSLRVVAKYLVGT